MKNVNEKDECGDPKLPDIDTKISKSDQKAIDDIVKILSHERFNHVAWGDYGYMDDAAYFILQYLKK